MIKIICDNCGGMPAESCKFVAPHRNFILDLCALCEHNFKDDFDAFIKNRESADKHFETKWKA